VHALDLEWEQNLNGMDNELKSLSEINYTQNQTKESRLKVKTKTMKDLFCFFFLLVCRILLRIISSYLTPFFKIVLYEIYLSYLDIKACD